MPLNLSQKIGVFCEDFTVYGSCPYQDSNSLIVWRGPGHKAWSGDPLTSFAIDSSNLTSGKISESTGKLVTGPWRPGTYKERRKKDEKPNIICGVTWRPSYYDGSFSINLPEWFVNYYVNRWTKTVNFRLSFTFGFTSGNDHYTDAEGLLWDVKLDVSTWLAGTTSRWSRAFQNHYAFSWVFDLVGRTLTAVKFPDAKIVVSFKIPWSISDSTSDHNVMLGVGVYCESYDNLRGVVPAPLRQDASDDEEVDVSSFELVL